MAVRGAESKDKIIAKILEVFPGSFKYDKEIRIPMNENGELIQIKCVLTAAKTNVDNGGDAAVPGDTQTEPIKASDATPATFMNEPTAEEKQNISELLGALGLA